MRALHVGVAPLKCRHAGTIIDHPALDGGGPRARTGKGTQAAAPSSIYGSEMFMRMYQRVLSRVLVDIHRSCTARVGARALPTGQTRRAHRSIYPCAPVRLWMIVDMVSSAGPSLPESGPACPGPIRPDCASTGTGNAALFHIKD
jgi:hypothetical protein